MECREVVVRLWEYLDGELAPEEVLSLRVHLDGCPRCRSCHCCDRAFLRLLRRALAAPEPAPPTLLASVRTRLSGPL
jgi:mycothiol system anti-sigma-R factor